MFKVTRIINYTQQFIKYCILKEVKRGAGHSKWANIKHIKALKDGQKSMIFSKMTQLIRVAIAEGTSSDPNSNVQLAHAVEQAKKNNMPVASIQNAIKSSQTTKSNAKMVNLELRGPGGVIIIISILSDNMTKTRSELNTLVKKCGNVTFSDGGGSRNLFDYKGVIDVVKTEETSLEKAVDDAIEVGAEDVTEVIVDDNSILQFVCAPEMFYKVKSRLGNLNYEIVSAGQEYLAHTHVSLSDHDLESIAILCAKLEDNQDVVKLYDNIA